MNVIAFFAAVAAALPLVPYPQKVVELGGRVVAPAVVRCADA